MFTDWLTGALGGCFCGCWLIWFACNLSRERLLISLFSVKFLSFPLWQDCHEMWCKKRRRKADGRNQEESSRSGSKQSKKETATASAKSGNGSLPATSQKPDASKPSKSRADEDPEKTSDGLTDASGLQETLSKLLAQKNQLNNSSAGANSTFVEEHTSDENGRNPALVASNNTDTASRQPKNAGKEPVRQLSSNVQDPAVRSLEVDAVVGVPSGTSAGPNRCELDQSGASWTHGEEGRQRSDSSFTDYKPYNAEANEYANLRRSSHR